MQPAQCSGARHPVGNELVGIGGYHVGIVPAHVVPAEVVHDHLGRVHQGTERQQRQASGGTSARGEAAAAAPSRPTARGSLTMTMWGFDAKSGIFAAAADEREAARRAAASMVGFSIVGSARVQRQQSPGISGISAAIRLHHFESCTALRTD